MQGIPMKIFWPSLNNVVTYLPVLIVSVACLSVIEQDQRKDQRLIYFTNLLTQALQDILYIVLLSGRQWQWLILREIIYKIQNHSLLCH